VTSRPAADRDRPGLSGAVVLARRGSTGTSDATTSRRCALSPAPRLGIWSATPTSTSVLLGPAAAVRISAAPPSRTTRILDLELTPSALNPLLELPLRSSRGSSRRASASRRTLAARRPGPLGPTRAPGAARGAAAAREPGSRRTGGGMRPLALRAPTRSGRACTSSAAACTSLPRRPRPGSGDGAVPPPQRRRPLGRGLALLRLACSRRTGAICTPPRATTAAWSLGLHPPPGWAAAPRVRDRAPVLASRGDSGRRRDHQSARS